MKGLELVDSSTEMGSLDWEVWSTFQKVPFILEIFRSVNQNILEV